MFAGGCYALYGFVVSRKHNSKNVDRNLVDLDMMSGAFASLVTPCFELEPVCRLFDCASQYTCATIMWDMKGVGLVNTICHLRYNG